MSKADPMKTRTQDQTTDEVFDLMRYVMDNHGDLNTWGYKVTYRAEAEYWKDITFSFRILNRDQQGEDQ